MSGLQNKSKVAASEGAATKKATRKKLGFGMKLQKDGGGDVEALPSRCWVSDGN